MGGQRRLGLLLGLSVVFVVMGLAVAAFGDWRLGLGNVGFFGMAAAVFAYQLHEMEKLNERASLLTFNGGEPLVMSSKRRLFFIAAMFTAGASSVLIGYERNAMLWWIGLALMLGGVVAFVLQLAGIPERRSLKFTPEGIHFLSGPAPCLLHFDNIASLQAAEWNGHIIIVLQPINLAALLLTVPEAKRDIAGKKFGESMAFMHAPLTIWASQFGLNARSLMKTIERWVREPETRKELQT